MISRMERVSERIARLLKTYEEGRIFREGASVVIAGRPNSGKSSLLNRLLGTQRAIVTNVPGTTRDIIEELANIRGIPMRLMDTAGLREIEDGIESIGVGLARKEAEDADLIIFLVDISAGIKDLDLSLIKEFSGRPMVVSLNKIDLVDRERIERGREKLVCRDIVPISALRGDGIEELKDILSSMIMVGCEGSDSTAVISNTRHKKSLESALVSLERAAQTLRERAPLELTAIDLRECLDSLGLIIGETTSEEILDHIFSRFCIGK